MWRKTAIPALFLLISLAQAGPLAANSKVDLDLPPTSIGQWYKPANKRQVWLHTMFSLRRELQAIEEYAEVGEIEALSRWSARFVDHYSQLGKMVPEWRDLLEEQALADLERAVALADFAAVPRALRKLEWSCDSCHRDYRTSTALLHRGPDFSRLPDTGEQMVRLSRQLNRFKIAYDDGLQAKANKALASFESSLRRLGEGCVACHRDDRQRRYLLGDETEHLLAQLREAAKQPDNRATGRLLGTLAVQVCASCHGIHRVQSELIEVFRDP